MSIKNLILKRLLSVLPIQTSPNWPAPSRLSILRDDLGISQASFSHGFSGLGLRHALVRVWQRPSPCSEISRKIFHDLSLLCKRHCKSPLVFLICGENNLISRIKKNYFSKNKNTFIVMLLQIKKLLSIDFVMSLVMCIPLLWTLINWPAECAVQQALCLVVEHRLNSSHPFLRPLHV